MSAERVLDGAVVCRLELQIVSEVADLTAASDVIHAHPARIFIFIRLESVRQEFVKLLGIGELPAICRQQLRKKLALYLEVIIEHIAKFLVGNAVGGNHATRGRKDNRDGEKQGKVGEAKSHASAIL
jgi:hypothetical protein